MEYRAVHGRDVKPTHPGEVLAEDVLPALDLNKLEFAERLGISRQHLYDILNCRKPVTAITAARLGKLLGNGGRLWLNMQAAHDLWHAERHKDIAAIKPVDSDMSAPA